MVVLHRLEIALTAPPSCNIVAAAQQARRLSFCFHSLVTKYWSFFVDNFDNA